MTTFGTPDRRDATIRQVVEALAARLGQTSVVEACEALLDGAPVAPAAALRTLGRVGDTEHVPAVRSALGDTGSQVRRAAALSLERMVARLDLPGEVLP